jgi:hypothetical protein
MHQFHDGAHVFNGRTLQNTMAEVEDMAGASSSSSQNIMDAALEFG